MPDAPLDALRAAQRAGGGRLYLGRGRGGLAFAAPEQALLVLGPPRAGKTTTLVIPNVLAAPGAVVSTSTKPDVLAATLPARSRIGRCWFYDPTGTTEAPAGTTPLRWSPVAASTTWDGALAVARVMVGAARPGGRHGEASHWTERAEALLAPLLHAAASSATDMRAVLGWTLRQEVTPAASALRGRGADVAADVLAGIAATDGREQSGIWSTAAGVLSAYRSELALATTVSPNFDPAGMAGTADTVYICAPAKQQALAAPAVVAFVEAVRAGAFAAPAGLPPLLLALDEVANIAPLPDLPAIVSEAGGQGVAVLACLQDLSQARQRWGAAAEGLLSLFGTKVVLPGVADLATLELVSRLGGEVDVPNRSVTRGRGLRRRRAGTVTWSTQRRRRLPVDAVNQLPTGSGLVLAGAEPPSRVRLTPWWATAPFAPSAAPEPRSQGRRRTERGLSP